MVALAGCGQLAAGAPDADRFVELGTITARIALDPVELGTPQVEGLSRALQNARAQHLEQAQDALRAKPQQGERGFAFVLIGCAETGAELQITESTIDAELTGNEDTVCAAPVYFLATFIVDADEVPEGAELGGG